MSGWSVEGGATGEGVISPDVATSVGGGGAWSGGASKVDSMSVGECSSDWAPWVVLGVVVMAAAGVADALVGAMSMWEDLFGIGFVVGSSVGSDVAVLLLFRMSASVRDSFDVFVVAVCSYEVPVVAFVDVEGSRSCDFDGES